MLLFTHPQPPLLLQSSRENFLNFGMNQQEAGITRKVIMSFSLKCLNCKFS